ncbi:uncharacterized protein LOC112552467 [Pogonomyrmex barbatus]|uniref:Uncharacterized protein LOC112552467 n=1 Tax=Pogonomyrmex barbatus TaxID=144034 RepID=A0A8N1S408_9HYME|nr:uncharacterized protein LOC112552467 [Pogonomyrmex barbatus]
MGIMIDKNILRISSPEREYIICKRIICAVGIHLRSFQFCKLLLSNIENLFAALIVIGVSSLSINLFRLLQEITLYDNMVDIFLSVGIIIIHFLYFFFGNHVGQLVMNNNGDIYNTMYVCNTLYILHLFQKISENLSYILLFELLISN